MKVCSLVSIDFTKQCYCEQDYVAKEKMSIQTEFQKSEVINKLHTELRYSSEANTQAIINIMILIDLCVQAI